MEKKKLLLVAISAGVFLVLTIGAAILVFNPKNVPAAMATGNPVQTIDTGINMPSPSSNNVTYVNQKPVDPVEMVRRQGDVPGLQSNPEGASRQNGDFYINGSDRNSETMISVPKPSTAAVPNTAPAGRAVSTQTSVPVAASRPAAASKPAETSRPAETKPSAQTTQSQPQTAAQTATQSASKTTPQAAAQAATQATAKPAQQTTPQAAAQATAKPAQQTRVYDDYWVQTGAFSTVAKAEGVKETLASKGITSLIENREVNGAQVFRVRVGPYTSQNEANYWLSLIKSIGGFEDSQIRQTRR